MTNSPSNACSSTVFVINKTEVLILFLLSKGDAIVVDLDDSTIKLEIIYNRELFALLGKELSFCKFLLFYYCKIRASNKESIIGL